jgi:prophage regulatory protein
MKSKATKANTPAPRILRRPQVEAETGLTRSGIYARINPSSPGYDATFPKPVNLGGRAVGWVAEEVRQWIEGRIASHRRAS